MNKTLIAVGILAVSLWGCTANSQVNRKDMLEKASALTKVSAALEAAVRFGDTPANLSESELLRRATAHDPDLLSPFEDYVLRARRSGLLSSVLMCSKDSRSALLEDAGCTPRFDQHLWERSPLSSCSFRLDLQKTCSSAR